MRALLSPSFFPEARRSRLGVLCEHGLERRHRLQVTDESHSDFLSWFDSLDQATRLEWDGALKYGNRDDHVHTSAFEIEIVSGTTSNWDLPCPKLSLKDGLDLLDEKFQIVLEGDAEDREFFERMSTSRQYDEICSFKEERRCLEFVPAGGIDSMIKRVKSDAQTPGARFRRWYLFDSDGLRHQETSDKSGQLHDDCEKHKIPCHQLERRMIENYIPLKSLRDWVNKLPPRKRQERAALFKAFKGLGTFENSTRRSPSCSKMGFAGRIFKMTAVGMKSIRRSKSFWLSSGDL